MYKKTVDLRRSRREAGKTINGDVREVALKVFVKKNINFYATEQYINLGPQETTWEG